MTSLAFFILAAVFEIAGCFAFRSYFRLARPSWTLIAGTVSLNAGFVRYASNAGFTNVFAR